MKIIAMTTVINIHQAKTQLSNLLARAQAGEEIVIAKAGKPQVRLVPIKNNAARHPGIAKGELTDAFFEPLPEDELNRWDPK
jgi:prevent-host-death family protein